MYRFPLPGQEDLSLVLCGAAGQGVQTVESLLVRLTKQEGFHVYASKEAMSRVRGGSNSTEIRLAPRPVRGLLDRMDLLVCFNKGVRSNVRDRIGPHTLILGDREELGEEFSFAGDRFVHAPLLAAARELGGPVYAGIVAVGLVARLLGIQQERALAFVEARFRDKGASVSQANGAALRRGYDLGAQVAEEQGVSIPLRRGVGLEERLLLSGNDAVSLGALAGGCDFVTAYPMSPGTGVLQFMAQNAAEFGVAVEQVEDELAAVNMALGAWYAGARALATTSGGGFALMTEGISLAGIAELPLVVHLAQRPGPATGMATRTEQGDLDLALYAGHGEFPRLILAPGTLEEAFQCARMAFDQADKHQIPVFLLTDQYFLDTLYDLPPFEGLDREPTRYVVPTEADYRRYRLLDAPLSPRGIPGWGEGLVGVDSHEHDEAGHIKEDFALRVRMNDKRLAKLAGVEEDSLDPVWTGPEDATTLVVGWGSTGPILDEALDLLGRRDVAHLHFPQVYPVPPRALPLLRRAKRVVAVEGNATGQFARLLERHEGVSVQRRVLHYSGLQMGVETAAARLEAVLEGREG